MRRLMFNLKLKLRAFICKVKAGMIHALGGVTKLESAQTVMNDRYTRRDIQIKTARYTRMIELRDTSPDYFKCYSENHRSLRERSDLRHISCHAAVAQGNMRSKPNYIHMQKEA